MQNQQKGKAKPIFNPDDIKIVWKIITKNWYLPVVISLLFLSIAYIYVHKLVDIYGATTQILLKENDTYQEKSVIGFDYGAYQETSNQMKVIKSANIIRAVIQKMEMDVSYYIVGRLKTTEVYRGVPFRVKVNSVSPKLYSLPIMFKITGLNTFKINYELAGNPKEIEGEFNKDLITNDFSLIIENTGLLSEITINKTKELDYLFKIINKEALVGKYSSGIQVTNEEYTNIITLSTEDEIPERAVAFLDTLNQVYIDYSLQTQFSINENTIKFIDKQLDEIVFILDSIESMLERFKDEKSILNLAKEEESYFLKLNQYDSDINQLDLSIEALNDLEKYIIEKKEPELLPPSIYINSSDDFLKSALAELYDLQIQRNQLLYVAKDVNTVFGKIDLQIEKLQSNILTYISNSRKAYKEKIADVKLKFGEYYSSLKTLPQKQRDLLNITRKQQVNEKMYMFLLEKRATAIIARANIVSNKKIIASPRTTGIIKPDKTKIYNNFLALALLISGVIIAIRTLLFNKIESYDELKKITEYPIWGEILFSEQGKSNYIVVEEDPKSPLTESFRTIRTNLDYIVSDKENEKKGKIILVTSNSPGEGKTFCSVNLAAILAKANKKVIVLEFDLHKPKIQTALGLKSENGLSLILSGKSQTSNCVLNTHIPNLDAVLSGPVPPNPSDLIMSKHLNEIIEYTSLNYEYVIIDTPPLGLISDSLILMRYADIVMFVLNPKVATKEVIRDVSEVINNNKIANFGYLLNGVKRKSSKYYYNKYAYGYGYGYGYRYGKSYGYGYGYGNSSKKSKT